MDDTSNGDLMESVFEILGEPAIVINGLPPVPSSESSLFPSPITISQQLPCLDKWLIGRDVRKQFGGQFFKGVITQYDAEMGWYQVRYQDGNSEDLDLNEVLGILVPLDVHIPLRALAEGIINKKQKSFHRSVKSRSRSRKNGSFRGKGDGDEDLENAVVPPSLILETVNCSESDVLVVLYS